MNFIFFPFLFFPLLFDVFMPYFFSFIHVVDDVVNHWLSPVVLYNVATLNKLSFNTEIKLCMMIFILYFYIAAEVRSDGQLLIHFDGWSNNYDYWTEPSTTDIHPIGWFDQCGDKYSKYSPQLQAPKGKIVNGCGAICSVN